MIYDSLDNIDLYKGLSAGIYEGLRFLKEASPDIAAGVYQICPGVKAIVSEYDTKLENENGFEAHRENIDIQALLVGDERIACFPIDRLTETKSYSQEEDVAFYAIAPSLQPSYLNIQPSYFAILYPQDGHMPQLCVSSPQKVKKVVVKVRLCPESWFDSAKGKKKTFSL